MGVRPESTVLQYACHHTGPDFVALYVHGIPPCSISRQQHVSNPDDASPVPDAGRSDVWSPGHPVNQRAFTDFERAGVVLDFQGDGADDIDDDEGVVRFSPANIHNRTRCVRPK